MSVDINWIGVIAAVIGSMVVGFVWYSRGMFGTVWARLAGMDDPKAKKGMFGPMLATLVSSVITAYLLAYFAFLSHAFFQSGFFMDAVVCSFWLAIGIAATTLVIHNSFEHKPWKLTALNIGNRFVTLIVMGVLIGLFKP